MANETQQLKPDQITTDDGLIIKKQDKVITISEDFLSGATIEKEEEDE